MKEHLKTYIDSSKTAHVRGLRILLEYFYATEIFDQITGNKIKIISVFGSARTRPNSPQYQLAYRLGGLLYRAGFAVVTGASRGIMEAANQGVADAIARRISEQKKAPSLEAARQTSIYKHLLKKHSVGLSISLPIEVESNPFVGVNATFHYFMVRKFFFGTLSSGFIACEGGWGTRDELYEMLTLVQTGKAPIMPILYLSQDPRHLEQDFHHALRKKYISPEDLNLIHLVKTPEQAVQVIRQFYRMVSEVVHDRDQVLRIILKGNVAAQKKRGVEKILSHDTLGPLQVEWRKRELILRQYAPSSYGTLRRAIDLLNK
jgi:uncharacterized protein (TIGR00730 family)